MNKAIEVIIVNYNAGDALLNSVSSALDPEGGIMVKVVDNASTDGSVEKLQGLYPEDGGLEIQCNQENLGFARAVNLAARGSTADYLLVLNPDCELHPGALDRLYSAMEENHGAGLAAPGVFDGQGKVQNGTMRRFPGPWNSLVTVTGLWRLGRGMPIFSGVNQMETGLPADTGIVEAVSGACMLVRNSTFVEVGGLDEAYGLHFEDLDLMYRLRQLGYSCLLVPSATATHLQGVSSSSRPYWVHRQKHLGMQRFLRKFRTGSQPAPIRWMVHAGIWLHYLLTLPLVLLRRSK